MMTNFCTYVHICKSLPTSGSAYLSVHFNILFFSIRLEFVSCVSKYSSRLCTLDATKFSMKMAETLIRTRTRAPIPDCIHINPKQCIPIIENGATHSMNYQASLLAFALTSVVITGSGCFSKSL